LEDDVMARVTREVHRSGKSLKVVVNDAIRRGLDPAAIAAQPPFRVQPSAMGVRPGMEIDDIQGLLDRLDGPQRR
jgi:hypothetical protein